MTLKSFAVERYRGFKLRTEVELRPLTLLFGYNSSGKSALLRLIPLLRDTVTDGRSPLFLGSSSVRGARFDDLHCRLAPKPTISLELASTTTRMRWDIRDLADRRRQVVETITRTTAEGSERLDWTTSGRDFELSEGDNPKGQVTLDTDGLDVRGVAAAGTPFAWPVPGADDLIGAQWIDAVRVRVPRRTPFGQPPHGPLRPDGSDAPSVLAFAKLDDSPIYETVARFFSELLGHRLEVAEVGDYFRLVVSPLNGSRAGADLVDTGEGLGQVLPIVVALAQASTSPTPSLLALEQPELHLHPRLHEKLAQWICELPGSSPGGRVIVETHSENFLLAVLIALVEGKLAPDDLAVYWVSQRDDGQSTCDQIAFDERALPSGNWPPDIFQEDAALASRLNRLRMGGMAS